MAEIGALIRVDTGRGNLIKMTSIESAAWAAAHPLDQPEVVAIEALPDAVTTSALKGIEKKGRSKAVPTE